MALDPRQADQQVRDVVVLPHGLGKQVRVLVFAQGDGAMNARSAGADVVADDDETLNKIQGGWLDFDVSYDVDGKQLPADLLRRGAAAGGYAKVDDKTWVAVDPKQLDAVEERLKTLAPTRENGRYRLPPLPVIADRSAAVLADFACGANRADAHLTGVNWGHDLPEPAVADLRNVVAGDPSPGGGGRLSIARGIEVGHIFQLGQKYSAAMGATMLDEHGQKIVLHMGCYGIGVTRIVAAAIEQNPDERGIVWPAPLAPFDVVLVGLNWDKSGRVRATAEKLYGELRDAGVEVLLDDRDARPGVKFADAELIGIPHRVVVSGGSGYGAGDD